MSDNSSAESGLSSLSFFSPSCSIVFCLSWLCCMCCPTQQLLSLPSPPLSKHLWAAAGLFCATPWVQVAEPKSALAACVSGNEAKGDGQGGNAPRTPAYDKDGPPPDSVGMQIECPPPVSAAAPLLQPTNTTHTYRHYMRTCTSHLKLTHLPLEDRWHHFSTSLCVILVLPSPSYPWLYSAAVLFVSLLSKPVFVSIYLSSPKWRHPCFSFHPCLLLPSDQ